MSRWAGWARWVVTGWALLGAWGVGAQEAAAPPPLPAEVIAHLRQLVELGLEQPDEALRRLRSEPVSPESRPWLRYTEARIQLSRGNLAAVRTLYPSAQPPADALALHVRALLARREGQSERAAAWVDQAMAVVSPLCPTPIPEAAAQREACPLPLWVDLVALATRQGLAQGGGAAGLERIERAMAWARQRRAVDLQAQLYLERADFHQVHDEAAKVDATLTEALALPGLSTRRRVLLLNYQAGMAAQRDQRPRQGELLEEALELALADKQLRLAAVLRGNLADFHVHQGRPKEARQLAELALPVLQRFDDVSEPAVRHNLALALIDERAFDAARSQLARLQEMPTQERVAERAAGLRELGDAWARAGQYKEALALFHAERKLMQAHQAQAKEQALEEVRQSLGSAQKEAELALAKSSNEVTQQTLENQDTLRQVAVAAGVLLALCLGLGGMFWMRARVAFRKLRHNQDLLKALSERDALTGLANRRQFHAVMAARGAQALEGSLVLIDIDHFKRINDGHGHAGGDVVIKTMADRLSQAVRDGDMVVRWGGEEYLVYAPTLKGTYTKQWVERLMPVLCGTPITLPDGHTLDVTCSMGFVTLPIPPLGVTLGWERALNWADLALYAAKNRGRRRAIGIAGLHVNDEVSLAQVESDFDGAASAARLSLVQVLASPAGG
ncbi:GGDEF domain-containing protein [Inhella crocodyli]|uniref:diguanylate cyclase n=1 Tax=Inhella crocodyli TaxID=2499851 RepID=A0A3S3T586_9BURK|nr:GGDEF domain-containing protein [Inhella crocodyli]RVT83628.1 GGDEF domain-containing protein [Inhella crocodyli]